jgi:hypothetical protein
VEAEKTLAEPRFLVRRDQGRIFISLSQDLASYAAKLGTLADQLANEDPLIPPARVLARLREQHPPSGASALSDSRLLRLAAAASRSAAVSSRLELYPKGMDAGRALKLSQGAIYGVPSLNVSMIRDRVRGRYPESAALPDRPELDELLRTAGFDFQWVESDRTGGNYVARVRDIVSISSGSETLSRIPTSAGNQVPSANTKEITPEIADARQFEDRLERGIKEGSFLALIANPKYYQQAISELRNRFPVEVVNIENIVIDSLKDVATKANAKWEAIVNADAKPGSEAWKKFMVLVNRAMPIVEKQLSSSGKTLLLIYPGLLARYDQMPMLERLREKVGRKDGVAGVWMLIPGDTQAMLDGKAIPIISPGQKTRIPDQWIRNEHRAISREKISV